MSKIIIGVGFMLFAKIDGAWKIFTVKELKDKPSISKKAGMVCFPMETFESEDKIIGKTIARLIEEEMGISYVQVEIIAIPEKQFFLLPERPEVMAMYAVGIFYGNPMQVFLPLTKDSEVIFNGWKTLDELLTEPLKRPSVDPMVAHFRENFEKRFFA